MVMVSGLGLTFLALLGLSVAGVAGTIYLESTNTVSYNVVAVPVQNITVTPFTVSPINVGDIVLGGQSPMIPVVVNNNDASAHLLSIHVSGLTGGDSVGVYADAAGTAYSPVSVPAHGSVTIYIRVTVGSGQGLGTHMITVHYVPG